MGPARKSGDGEPDRKAALGKVEKRWARAEASGAGGAWVWGGLEGDFFFYFGFLINI
jgi:hypothetical protein